VNFEEGKLYKCSKHLLMIYPTRENAMLAASVERDRCSSLGLAPWCAVARARRAAALAASYWSDRLSCSVRYNKPNEIFIFLKEKTVKEHKYLNVLFGDKQGWIVYEDWLRIERVKI